MKRLLIAVLLLTLAAPAAYAKKKMLTEFKKNYPATNFDCNLCHIEGSEDDSLNSYGTDLNDSGFDYKAIEAKDSDGDGATNLTEINAGTLPGDMSSVP